MNSTIEKNYEKIADALVLEGYIIIDNILGSKITRELKKFAESQTHFKKAGISGAGELHLDSNRRRDSILWLNEDDSVQSDYLGFANGLKNYLNRTLYLGLSYYESHFSVYNEGDFYEKHLDAFRNSKNRVVTTVYYLNDEWNEEDGGELIIYDEEGEFLKKVTPNTNTLVVFLSDKFPHEVLPTKRKRYSIAGWFRVDR